MEKDFRAGNSAQDSAEEFRTRQRRKTSTLLVSIFAALFGLAFGSFLNVCISRLPRHESIVRPGSKCPSCGAAIRVSDNLPVVSWMVLGGRCRTCRWRIPWRYPAVEVATAALFVLCYLRFGLTFPSLGMAVLSFLLLGLAVMDAETMRLPDAFTLPGIALGVIYASSYSAAGPLEHLWNGATSLLFAGLAAFFILIIRWSYYFLRRTEGMGVGDAKLMAMIAAWLGPPLTLLTLFVGTLAAAIIGLLWVAASRGEQKAMTARLPFGSFLCAAALYAIYAGEPVVHWYAKFFR